jgi:hypothetical protein
MAKPKQNIIIAIVVIAILLFFAASFIMTKENTPCVGCDKDIHGCIGSAGYSWCEAKQKCLRIWEENCTTSLCNCPDGYVQAGDVCNPKCYYSTPKCLMPSIQCTSEKACTAEAKLCPDGSAVGRTGPNCEFAPCPAT